MNLYLKLTLFPLLFTTANLIAQKSTNIESIEKKTIKAEAQVELNKTIGNSTKEHITKLTKTVGFYQDFKKEELLKGSLGGGFLGNFADLENNFNVNTNAEADFGIYPLEVDFKFKFQRTISSSFRQSTSGIDISADFHPKIANLRRIKYANKIILKLAGSRTELAKFDSTYIGVDNVPKAKKLLRKLKNPLKNKEKTAPSNLTSNLKDLKFSAKWIDSATVAEIRDSLRFIMKERKKRKKVEKKWKREDYKNTGLGFETYIVLKSFDNSFLGINERYEGGLGIILNKFSSQRLTDTGEKKQEKLDLLTYDFDDTFTKATLGELFIKLVQNTQLNASNYDYIEFVDEFKKLYQQTNQDSLNTFLHFLKDSVVVARDSSENKWLEKEKYPFFDKNNRAFKNVLRKISKPKQDTIKGLIAIINKNQIAKKTLENLILDFYSTGKHDNIIECYKNACSQPRINLSTDVHLNKEDVEELNKLKFKFRNTNIKRYAKWRFALLMGIYFELEDAILKNDYDNSLRNKIGFDNQELTEIDFPFEFNPDSTFSIKNFDYTYKWRFAIRPTLEWQPNDKIKFNFKPYIKFPVSSLLKVHKYKLNEVPVLKENGKEDEDITTDFFKEEEGENNHYFKKNPDIFLDLTTNINFKITPSLSFNVEYVYLEDLSPKRIYLPSKTGTDFPLVGQKKLQQFNFSIKYGF